MATGQVDNKSSTFDINGLGNADHEKNDAVEVREKIHVCFVLSAM